MFKGILESKGIHTYVRGRGAEDIFAACGQLAAVTQSVESCDPAHSGEATPISLVYQNRKHMRLITKLALTTTLLLIPANFLAAALPQSAPNIPVNGSLVANKIGRGRTVQGTVVMDIPSGYHANSTGRWKNF